MAPQTTPSVVSGTFQIYDTVISIVNHKREGFPADEAGQRVQNSAVAQTQCLVPVRSAGARSPGWSLGSRLAHCPGALGT